MKKPLQIKDLQRFFAFWRSGRESSPALRQALPTLKKAVFPLVRVDENVSLQSVAP